MFKVRVRPKRLILVGSIIVDILLYIDKFPSRGSDIMVHHNLVATGGGFNVLSAASRLNMKVAYAGRVGGGIFGQKVAQDLDDMSIPLLLEPEKTSDNILDTGFDIAIVEKGKLGDGLKGDGVGQRTFITAPGIESCLSTKDLDGLNLYFKDAIYISGYELTYPVSGSSITSWLYLLDDDKLLVVDTGPLLTEIPIERLDSMLARVDILSMNLTEAALLFERYYGKDLSEDIGGGGDGNVEIEKLAVSLCKMVKKTSLVVVRTGANGCVLAQDGIGTLHIPGRQTVAVDTTGAGDVHTGALLARLSAGDDPTTAARIANIAAGMAVEKKGPSSSPSWAELEAVLVGEKRTSWKI
ncbi:MAG: PfkB family carbohydrate kinase [Actinobacteria bacterium]|nr:PfkB family carbohydrate kinase [Actinomycetota bacterium]MCL6105209.1 PfkB family carbohydrate kinase [Actinomycetota bacterium]